MSCCYTRQHLWWSSPPLEQKEMNPGGCWDLGPSEAILLGFQICAWSSWVQKQYLTQYPGWVVCSLLMHPCMLFFCDSPEWGADKRFLTHSSLSGAKGNSSALSSGPVSSQNFGMARNLWHGREAKLLTSIKTVAVLA